MPTAIRRSGRTRTLNRKYVNNDWDESALKLIRGSSSEVESEQPFPPDSLEEEDEEFVAHQATPEIDDEDSQSEIDHVSSTSGSDGAHDTDVEDQVGDDDLLPSKKKPFEAANIGIKRMRWQKQPDEHSRGLLNFYRKGSNISIYRDTFGPTSADHETILKTRKYWNVYARDATRPSTSSLRDAYLHEWQKLCSPLDEHMPSINLASSQVQTQTLSIPLMQRRGYLPKAVDQQVFLGPANQQQQFRIGFLTSIDLGTAWERTTDGNSRSIPQPTRITDGGSQSDHGLVRSINRPVGARQSADHYHEGWLLNVGERVRCFAWGSLDNDGVCPLAVACRATSESRNVIPPPQSDTSKAFSPSPCFPSSIQIWQISSTKVHPPSIHLMNFDSSPQLRGIIATNIGDIRQVEWRPKIAHPGSRTLLPNVAELLCLSTDGCVRLFDTTSLQSTAYSPTFVDSQESTICCIHPPPGAVFTTFTMANSDDIIIGGSDGWVRIYNLGQLCLDHSTQPFLSLQLHHTYILRLVTAGQGKLSHFLASTSAAGDMRLTDLRSPFQDTITVPRTRIPTNNLIYCPQTQSFITAINHSGRTEILTTRTTVAAHQLRHFHSQISLNKFPSNSGTASALAGSKFHPYVLCGITKGTVVCQNILRKLLPRSGNWIQKVCEYEWVPLDTAPEHATMTDTPRQTSGKPEIDTTEPDLYYGPDVRPGNSRFHEGFQIEKPEITAAAGGIQAQKIRAKGKGTSTGKGKDKNKGREKGSGKGRGKGRDTSHNPDDDAYMEPVDDDVPDTGVGDETVSQNVIAEVIFEEEQAVTAMAWHEDPRCASWVAIGWGSGIVRIQDLSHDTK